MRRGRLPPGRLVDIITKTVRLHFGSRLEPYFQGVIVPGPLGTGQGVDVNNVGIANQVCIARTGEGVWDGGSYRVLVAYTSAVAGDEGGPTLGDIVLNVNTTDGNVVVLGRIGL